MDDMVSLMVSVTHCCGVETHMARLLKKNTTDDAGGLTVYLLNVALDVVFVCTDGVKSRWV